MKLHMTPEKCSPFWLHSYSYAASGSEAPNKYVMRLLMFVLLVCWVYKSERYR